jgi:hypothetical protein
VHEIIEAKKDIGPGFLTVYRGFENPGMKLIFEIEAGSGITLFYK